MQLFYQSNLPETKYLDPEESKHCVKVLRKSEGDEIHLIDGKGTFYTAVISNANHKKCEFDIKDSKNETKFPFRRHLAIAPTKNIDRIEWFVEKATELGVDEISFIQTFHSERKLIKLDRLEKKVLGAMKQSMKATKPQLNEILPFEKFIENNTEINKCIAFVDFQNDTLFKTEVSSKLDTILLIGPEGDFTEEEVLSAEQNGFKKVSLGQSRLRTETAALAGVHMMNLAAE